MRPKVIYLASLIDLDFVDDKPHNTRERMLYGLAAFVCIIAAIIGAIFPILPAIPFWILGAINLAHAFPAFGRFLRGTRLYQWAIKKLENSTLDTKLPELTRKQKLKTVGIVTVLMAVLLIVVWLLPLAQALKWIIRIVMSLVWVAVWLITIFVVDEPRARYTKRPHARSNK